jgi:ribonuclease Z
VPPKRIRVAGEKLPPAGVTVEEFDQDGIVYEKGGLKVIAFEVDYGDAIEPADGYLFDLRLMSACLSAMDLKFISL